MNEPWPEQPFMAQWESRRRPIVLPIPVYAADSDDALECAAVIVQLAAQRAVPRE